MKKILLSVIVACSAVSSLASFQNMRNRASQRTGMQSAPGMGGGAMDFANMGQDQEKQQQQFMLLIMQRLQQIATPESEAVIKQMSLAFGECLRENWDDFLESKQREVRIFARKVKEFTSAEQRKGLVGALQKIIDAVVELSEVEMPLSETSPSVQKIQEVLGVLMSDPIVASIGTRLMMILPVVNMISFTDPATLEKSKEMSQALLQEFISVLCA